MLLENRLNDIKTIKKNGLLNCEGDHDSDLFSLLIRAIELGKNTQLETSAIAEVLFYKLINRGLKTRNCACINGYKIDSDSDYHYCNDEVFSSKDELKRIIHHYDNDDYAISDLYADQIVKNVFDYLDNRFNYPR